MNSELVCLNTTDASHRLILLHGWGADAEDLIPLGELLIGDLKKKIEIISLRAPTLHPQGLGRQWYPLFPPDWSSVPSAIEVLQNRLKIISNRKIPLEKTVLLGFSQGGAMALESGCNLPLAGLICCSAYPHPNWLVPKNLPPICLTHGQKDEVVPYIALEKIKDLIKNNQSELYCESFQGSHEIPTYLIPKLRLILDTWFK